MTTLYPLLPLDHQPLSFKVSASAERKDNFLMLTFWLADKKRWLTPKNQQVIWPARQPQARQDYLWENTCFEAFIGTTHKSEYFELNLASSSAWNLYHFDDYRRPDINPPRKGPEWALINFEIGNYGYAKSNYALRARIDLEALDLASQEIHLGLTAVIKTQTDLYYLALHHPASQADFHDARGWTITLLPDARFPESVVDNNA